MNEIVTVLDTISKVSVTGELLKPYKPGDPILYFRKLQNFGGGVKIKRVPMIEQGFVKL